MTERFSASTQQDSGDADTLFYAVLVAVGALLAVFVAAGRLVRLSASS